MDTDGDMRTDYPPNGRCAVHRVALCSAATRYTGVLPQEKSAGASNAHFYGTLGLGHLYPSTRVWAAQRGSNRPAAASWPDR